MIMGFIVLNIAKRYSLFYALYMCCERAYGEKIEKENFCIMPNEILLFLCKSFIKHFC